MSKKIVFPKNSFGSVSFYPIARAVCSSFRIVHAIKDRAPQNMNLFPRDHARVNAR